MKIGVETVVTGNLNQVWDAWNNPADIKQWNTAHDKWYTTRSTVDLPRRGKFLSRVEAKDRSEGFVRLYLGAGNTASDISTLSIDATLERLLDV